MRQGSNYLSVSEFLDLAQKSYDQSASIKKTYPVIDVRTPSEFAHGSIPGAFNLPLFSDEERVIVGTIYKQQGREKAILKGLELVGPKMVDIIKMVEETFPDKSLFLHCWRGGMRSSSVAWLLQLYGYKIFLLQGGYKSYRKHVLETINKERNVTILGGRTGSGKTLVLNKLKDVDEQIIDLEGLTDHRGSAFGAIGQTIKPTQEQFENKLALALSAINPSKTIWVEDESQLLGKKVIPQGLWVSMRRADVMYIEVPFDVRANYLMTEYGKFDKEELKLSIEKISKRLGGLSAKNAIAALDINDYLTACSICLHYYDKTYDHGLAQRESRTVARFSFDKIAPEEMAVQLKQSLLTLTNERNKTYSI